MPKLYFSWLSSCVREVFVLKIEALGGRLDATTAAGDPAACVITSISLDHQEYLGNTVEQIAWEKAGILVRDVPAVYDGLDGRAAGVIAGQAEALGIEAVCLKENDVHVRSACFFPWFPIRTV